MIWHSEALAPSLRPALRALPGATAMDVFYLAGGTALALRLGHRLSRDLDFFSREETLDVGGRGRLLGDLERLRGFALEEQKEGALHARLGRGHLSFFHYPHRLIGRKSRFQRLWIASLEDIALMKLSAVISRGVARDFVDLYFACKVVPLGMLFELAAKKYPKARDFVAASLRALAYFEDAERDPPPPTLVPVAWPEVRRYFEGEARRLAQRRLG